MAEQRRDAPATPPALNFRPGGGPPMAFLQDAPKSKDARGTLRRMWSYLERQRWVLVGVLVLVILTSIVDLLGPFLMGLAINSFISKSNLPGLARLLGWMIASYILAAAGTWLQTYLMAGVAQRAVRDMRTDLFARLQTLPLRFFDQRAHGDIMSRLTNDVENISNILANNASQLIANVLGVVGVIIIMFIMNVPLAIISLIVMPLTYFITRAIAQTHTRQFPRNPADAGRTERHHRGDHHRRACRQGIRARGSHHGAVFDGQPPPAKSGPAGACLYQFHGPTDEYGQQPGAGGGGLRRWLAGSFRRWPPSARSPPSSTMPAGLGVRLI